MPTILEAIQANVEQTIQGMTTAAGYALPKNLGLVTRKILDYDETTGQRPACIIQFTFLRQEPVGLGQINQGWLEARLIFYFDLDTGPMLPATWANAYTTAAEQALLKDESRGQEGVLTTLVNSQPTALLWKTGAAFEATQTFEIPFMYERGT